MDLDKVLLTLSKQGDTWTTRDAVRGTQIFGGIGSGKSSGSGKTIAKAFLKNNFGGLILCAKPDEKDNWVKFCQEVGREKDLLIFEEDSEFQFNPLQYELMRKGRGGGEVFNLSNLFMEIYKMGSRLSGAGGGDKDRYWDNALRRSLNRMILLLKLSGVVVDAKLLPILQEAEKGDYTAMKELWEMFVYGTNKVKPNYSMAKRYYFRLSQRAKLSKEPINVAQSMINKVYMMREFESDFYITLEAMLEAFKYMINYCEFEDWDLDFFTYARSILELRLIYPED